MVLILPKASARRLVASADPQEQQAAVLEGEAFLNAAPISFWPRAGEELVQEAAAEPAPAPALVRNSPPPTTAPEPTVSPRLMKPIVFPNVAAKIAPAPLDPATPHRD